MNRSDRVPPSASDDAIAKAASDWITRLDRGLTPDEAAQFAAWEAADPRHRAELAHMNGAWRLLDTADEVPEIMRFAHEVEQRQERRASVRRWLPWTLVGGGLAAALVVVATLSHRPAARVEPVAALTAGAASDTRSYQVIASTARRLALADGSLVELRADSQVEPAFSATERRVSIVRGEAHFTVAKDARRPFVVYAGGVAVSAVGTAFNVRLSPGNVEVLVTEGQVRVHEAATQTPLLSPTEPSAVTPPLLRAGQQVTYAVTAPTATAPRATSPDDRERALAWRSPQLVFDRTSLEEAVAAFNSFNRQQLVLGDSTLRMRRLGGTFRADNIEAFVRLLETGFDITAEPRNAVEIVLRPVSAGTHPK